MSEISHNIKFDDVLTIVDPKTGRAKFRVMDQMLEDLQHDHAFGLESTADPLQLVCTICKKTKKQIDKESYDNTSKNR